MRRKLCVLLVMVLAFGACAGCGKKDEKVDNTESVESTITDDELTEGSAEDTVGEETESEDNVVVENDASESTAGTTSTKQSTTEKKSDKTTEEKKSSKKTSGSNSSETTEEKKSSEKNNSTNSSSKEDTTTSTENKKESETHKHSYSKSKTNPTCTEQGYTTYSCTCGDSYNGDYVSAKGHTEVIDKAVSATTSSTGLTEGKHCSVCGKVLVEQKVVDKIIEYFYTKDININWNYKTGVTYSDGGYLYCDYQIVSASCVAKRDQYVMDESYSGSCLFTLKVTVKCKTALRYMKVPYVIKDSSGNIIEQDYILAKYSDTSSYTKNVNYTISTSLSFPLVADTYTITLGN